MKRYLIVVVCLMFLFLTACSKQPADTSTDPVTTTQTTTGTVIDTTEPSQPDTTAAADLFELANGCIDKPVEDLYELIGEPESFDYAPSCMGEGEGEDGNLYYEGFVVYTFRENGVETVVFVERTE